MTPLTARDHGRAAYAEHRWRDAVTHLTQADRDGEVTAEDLAQLGTATVLIGSGLAGVDLLARAHARYLAEGDVCAAA
ncbi:MAG: DNA-binding response regulator, partial [Actinomycetes bacterium]